MTASAKPHALRSSLRQNTGPADPAVLLTNVTRVFGVVPGIVRVDLRLERGEMLLVRGPNGAGKSTLLRVVATALSPTYGSGMVLGFDLIQGRTEIRRRTQLLGHRTRLYEDLTARENLRFACHLYGLDGAGIEPALERMSLGDVAGERINGYSHGMRQRVALARTLLHRPEVLLLDEPYAGLDEEGKRLVDDLIEEAVGEGRTVVLATHDPGRGAMAGRTIAMEGGRIQQEDRGAPTLPVPVPARSPEEVRVG